MHFLPTLGWCQGVQNRHIWHSHGVLGIGNAPTQGLRTIVLMTEPVSSLMLSTVFRCPLGNGYIASSPTSCQQMLCLGQAMLFPKCEAFQLATRHHNMEICGNSTCAPSVQTAPLYKQEPLNLLRCLLWSPGGMPACQRDNMLSMSARHATSLRSLPRNGTCSGTCSGM